MSFPIPGIVGDRTFLGSLVGNFHFFGVVVDAPALPGSIEIVTDDDGNTDITAVLPVNIGPPGIQGESTKIVKMQWETNLDSASELPRLTNTPADIGKAFWIENVIFAWSGTDWFPFPLGVSGPPGPVPIIDVAAELVPSNTLTSLTQPIYIKQAGEDEIVSLLFQFDQDTITGPPGPTGGPLRDSSDFDNVTHPPEDGDAIVWSTGLQGWQASGITQLAPEIYSVPAGNFTAYKGIGTEQTVCTFAIPPRPFAWRPMVFGNVKLSQSHSFFNLFNPKLALGCSVLLGDPINGQLVGRAFGTLSDYAPIFPQFSFPAHPVKTVDTALVPAFHVGNQGTIYLTISNDDKRTAAWQFNPSDAELLIVVMPESVNYGLTQMPERLTGHGQLTAVAGLDLYGAWGAFGGDGELTAKVAKKRGF